MKDQGCKGKNGSFERPDRAVNDMKVLTILAKADVLGIGGGDHTLTRHFSNEFEKISIPFGIQLAGHVIEHQKRRFAKCIFEVFELGNLEGEHQRAQLSLRAVKPRRPAGELQLEVVYVRSHRGKSPRAVA